MITQPPSPRVRLQLAAAAFLATCALLLSTGCTNPTVAKEPPAPSPLLVVSIPHLERVDVSHCKGSVTAINTVLSDRADLYARSLTNSSVWYGEGLSMEPLLEPGSWLVTRLLPFSELNPGMVVLYTSTSGHPVAHALIRQTSHGWLVAGVNNRQLDSEYVTSENCMGVIVGAFTSATKPAGLIVAP